VLAMYAGDVVAKAEAIEANSSDCLMLATRE
jgi:hypothetical protein